MDDISNALGRMEGKLDAIRDDLRRKDERLDDHGKRINTLERWQSRVLGIAGGVGMVFGIAASLVWKLIVKVV